MKKILLVHTRYRITGGEDIAVDNEILALKKIYDVEALIFSNIEIDNICLIFLLPLGLGILPFLKIKHNSQ